MAIAANISFNKPMTWNDTRHDDKSSIPSHEFLLPMCFSKHDSIMELNVILMFKFKYIILHHIPSSANSARKEKLMCCITGEKAAVMMSVIT